MSGPISNLAALIGSMQPVLNQGAYYYANVSDDGAVPFAEIVAAVREQEGLSLIVSERTAQRYRLNAQFRCAWITLKVHSDLAAVGLTAAFAAALGKADISCNVVAGNFHDHIFVPFEQRDAAMEALRKLQREYRGESGAG